jgi:hypothetical protein
MSYVLCLTYNMYMTISSMPRGKAGREGLQRSGNTECPQNRGSYSGEKGLSLSEGLGKEYMKWRKTSVGKTGT